VAPGLIVDWPGFGILGGTLMVQLTISETTGFYRRRNNMHFLVIS
jgi:hypothetical protein